MTEIREIKCDQCGHDLTYTGNCNEWHLVLGNQAMRPWYEREGMDGGAVTSMALYPPVNRTHHFCDLPCMIVWANNKVPDASQRHAKLLAHREWLLAKQRSPTPPDGGEGG